VSINAFKRQLLLLKLIISINGLVILYLADSVDSDSATAAAIGWVEEVEAFVDAGNKVVGDAFFFFLSN